LTDDAHGDPARYNLFAITGKPGAWHCSLREFGYRRGGTEVELLLEMQVV
jgi:hypothetical protein